MKRNDCGSKISNFDSVITIGTYTNACSIVWGIRKIGFTGSVIMIDPNVDQAKSMAEVIMRGETVVKKKIDDLNAIVDLVKSVTKESENKLILMTAEEFIEPIRMAIQKGDLPNTVSFTGSRLDNELIFDRFKFYRFVEALNCIAVPRTVDSDCDPKKEFGAEYVIRVNKSWEGNRKLPRLEIVHSEEEAQKVEASFISQGLTRDMWSYQELLSTKDTHNVSVCGWYDLEFKQFVVTRKVLQHPPKTGNGDVVETFSDVPEKLLTATEAILKALDYVGAFEMEFVFDENTNCFKLIELNPRFWMQHGLVEEVTDYALLRRALGMPINQEIPVDQIKHRYWINGLQALYRLAKGQVILFRYMTNGKCYPSLMKSAKWALYYGKYKKAMNGQH